MPFSYPPHKSTIAGADANVIAWIPYIASFVLSLFPVVRYFAWAAPMIFFFLERESALVRYHAVQAFVLGISISIINAVLDLLRMIFQIPLLFTGNFFATISSALISLPLGLVSFAAGILFFVFSVKSIISAHRYQENTIPFISFAADKIRGFFGK